MIDAEAEFIKQRKERTESGGGRVEGGRPEVRRLEGGRAEVRRSEGGRARWIDELGDEAHGGGRQSPSVETGLL